MAKAKQQAASTTDDSTRKKSTRRTAATKTKAPTKSTAAMKPTAARKAATTTKAAVTRSKPKAAAKKPALKKAAPAKAPRTAAAKAKTPARRTATARAKKPLTTAAAKRTKTTARRRSLVVEVTPAVIDTSLAAEVAAARVLQGQAKAETLAQSNTPVAPPQAVKRASSALRHVKESLASPISRQLDSVLGPLMTPHANAFRGGKSSRPERALPFGKKFEPHAGHFGVPRRAAG